MDNAAFEMWGAICLVSMIAVPVIACTLMAAIEITFKTMDLIDWLRS